MFNGFLKFVLSNDAKLLRQSHTFYMFPCLNPDGVEFGNSRNNLAGFDLNRMWLNPHE